MGYATMAASSAGATKVSSTLPTSGSPTFRQVVAWQVVASRVACGLTPLLPVGAATASGRPRRQAGVSRMW